MDMSATGRLLFVSSVKPEVTVELFKLFKHEETQTELGLFYISTL